VIVRLTIPVLVQIFAGGGAVLALWLYVRLGPHRPSSAKMVAAHMVLALLLLALMPSAIRTVGGTVLVDGEIAGVLFAVFLPVMTYVFLTSIWVIALLQRALSLR
jgi:hypothetical protein